MSPSLRRGLSETTKRPRQRNVEGGVVVAGCFVDVGIDTMVTSEEGCALGTHRGLE